MVCFDLSTAGWHVCALTEKQKEMNESLQAISCPLTLLSLLMLGDIHAGLCRDISVKLIAAKNGHVKTACLRN